MNKEQNRCAICLEPYTPLPYKEGTDPDKSTVIGLLNKCGHIFHFDCIWQWLETNTSCPICRQSMDITTKNIKAISGKAIQTVLANATPRRRSEVSENEASTGNDVRRKQEVSPSDNDSDCNCSPYSPGKRKHYHHSSSRSSSDSSTRGDQYPDSPSRSQMEDEYPRMHRKKKDRRLKRLRDRENLYRQRSDPWMPRDSPYIISIPMGSMDVVLTPGPSYFSPVPVYPSATEFEWTPVVPN